MLWWRRRQAKSKNAAVRSRAAVGLRKHVSSDGIRVLAGLLFDSDPAVVAAAAESVRKSPNGAAGAFLMDELALKGNIYRRVREWAAKALGLLGDPALAPSLVDRLEDPCREVGKAAAQSLSKLGWRPLTPHEQAWFAMNLEDWDTVFEIAGKIVPELVKAVSMVDLDYSGSTDLTAAAMAALPLGRTNDPRAVEPLVELQWRALEHSSKYASLYEFNPELDVGSAAQDSVVIAFANMSDSVALKGLLAILKDQSKNPRLRAAAALCLGNRGANDEESFNTVFSHASRDIDAGVERACSHAFQVMSVLLAAQKEKKGKPPSDSAQKPGKKNNKGRR